MYVCTYVYIHIYIYCPGPNVTMRPNDHIARHIRLGMYEGRRMYYGNEIKELVYSHLMRVLKW